MHEDHCAVFGVADDTIGDLAVMLVARISARQRPLDHRIADLPRNIVAEIPAGCAHHRRDNAGDPAEQLDHHLLFLLCVACMHFLGIAVRIGMALNGMLAVLLAHQHVLIVMTALAHDEERRLRAIVAQMIEHAARGAARSAVVVCQCDHVETVVLMSRVEK